MAKLLKFSCQNCGAKLAVPLHMAGLTDHCPKCGNLVTSPNLPPEPAADVVSKKAPPAPPEAWSSAELADALRPAGTLPPPAQLEPPQSREEVPEPTPEPEPPPAEPEATAPLPEPQPPKTREPEPEPEAETESEPEALEQPSARPLEPSAPVIPEAIKEAEEVGISAPLIHEPATQPEDISVAEEKETAVAAVQESHGQEEKEAPSPSPVLQPRAVSGIAPSPAAGGSHSVLTSILGRQEVSPKKKTDPVVVLRTSRLAEAEADSAGAPPPTRSALHPTHTTDEEAELAAMPGMGEVLAAQHVAAAGAQAGGAETRPWQAVPFLPVSSSPTRVRKARLTRVSSLGIVIFLVVDLIVLGWLFHKPILSWWSGDDESVSQGAPASSTKASTAADPAGSSTSKDDSTPTPAPTPTVEEGSPVISSPSDFVETGAGTPAPQTNAKPVPLAIPITANSLPALRNLPGANAPTASTVPLPPLSTSPSTAPATMPVAPAPLPEPGVKQPSTEPLPPPSSPPSPPPLPSGQASDASLSGFPPPPDDMAFPNGAPPADIQASLNAADAPAPVTGAGASASASGARINAVPAEAKPALDALVKFLDAPSFRERLKYSPNTPATQRAMENYAAAYGDGPIPVASIEFVERYVNKNGVPPYCMFEVAGGALHHPVLVLVEQPVKGAAKVDWEAFVEFKDDLLLKFLEKVTPAPKKFRVMVRRKHYFDKDVPNMSEKDGFELKQPNGAFEGHVFVPRNSTLGRQLANQLAWGMDMPVIAELAWMTVGENSWVEMKSISSYGWRG